MVSTKLQVFSAISQNQGTAKVVAPLGCPQQFSFHQQPIYLYAPTRHKYQYQAAQPLRHTCPGVTLGIYTRFRDEEIDNAGAAILDSLRGKSDYLIF
jgi:hypothetical protein